MVLGLYRRRAAWRRRATPASSELRSLAAGSSPRGRRRSASTTKQPSSLDPVHGASEADREGDRGSTPMVTSYTRGEAVRRAGDRGGMMQFLGRCYPVRQHTFNRLLHILSSNGNEIEPCQGTTACLRCNQIQWKWSHPLPAPVLYHNLAAAGAHLLSLEPGVPASLIRTSQLIVLFLAALPVHILNSLTAWKLRESASAASVLCPAPACSPLLVFINVDASGNASMDDALNVFDEAQGGTSSGPNLLLLSASS